MVQVLKSQWPRFIDGTGRLCYHYLKMKVEETVPVKLETMKEEIMQALPFTDTLRDDEKRLLLESAFEARYPAGKFLVESGALCENVYVVLEGLIRIYKLSEEGREITYYRVGSGETCLFTMGCILEHQPFDAVAEIEQPSRLLAIPSYVFERLMDENPAFRNHIIRRLLGTITDLMMLTEEVTFHSMNRRLAGFLLNESNLRGSLHLTMTHETISQELGTAREVVSRMLKEFEKKYLLVLSRGKIVIRDVEGLEGLAE